MRLPQTQTHSRFQLPSSIRLLLAPGIRGHTLVFLTIMSVLFGAAYLGRGFRFSNTWTVVFSIGASTTGTYLILALLALFEKMRSRLFFSKMTMKILSVSILFAPILAGTLYWTSQAGSVEALPVFPLFIGIFYAWILLQAYFIATPVSQALGRVERNVTGDGRVKKILRTLGTTVLFLPIAPLAFGVWEISSWATQNYQNIQGSDTKILAWTMIVLVALSASYFLTVVWGWRNIKQNEPQSAIFAGGMFLILWAYLLYRGTSLLLGFVGQNQPSSALIDTGLMIFSILGAMQTFARKTINRANRRWSQVSPFLVFSFGSVYVVAQFYFILQVALTRADLSIIVNGTVFATGLLTMMFLIRKHLSIPTGTSLTMEPSPTMLNLEPESSEGPAASSADSSLDNVEEAEENTEESSERAGE